MTTPRQDKGDFEVDTLVVLLEAFVQVVVPDNMIHLPAEKRLLQQQTLKDTAHTDPAAVGDSMALIDRVDDFHKHKVRTD